MKNRLCFVLAAALFTIVPVALALAADGYWIFDSYGERISPRDHQGKACVVTGVAKMNGSKLDVSCTDVYGKPYGFHGHFGWQYANLSGILVPGQKVSFKGVVTNTSGIDKSWTGSISQSSTHPAAGNLRIMGTQPASKAGQGARAEGTWIVPGGGLRPMPDGKPSKLMLIFALGCGSGAGADKYFFYRWQAGQPPAGAGTTPLPLDPAGTVDSPAVTSTPAQTAQPPQQPVHPARSAPPVAQAPATPVSPATIIFDSFNAGGVGNGPSSPTTFTLKVPYVITQIQTYHWNSGRGFPAGTLALRDQSGKVYGPWPAKGSPGHGGVPDAFWTVNPNITIPVGAYTVVDSNPATWSTNSASGNRGFAQILARPAN